MGCLRHVAFSTKRDFDGALATAESLRTCVEPGAPDGAGNAGRLLGQRLKGLPMVWVDPEAPSIIGTDASRASAEAHSHTRNGGAASTV